jgi:hypothetical protein
VISGTRERKFKSNFADSAVCSGGIGRETDSPVFCLGGEIVLAFGSGMYYIYTMELDFEIDKITESIEHAGTGESFATLVLPMDKADL